MKALGVIVEYNPFHNGHDFHLQQSKKATDADIVIAVMSGPFLQRGEPAIVSKWSRAKMALLSGVDIVFELPYTFAAQQADIFASGAVQLLDAARCDYVCFGSEEGSINPFLEAYDYLNHNKKLYDQLFKGFSKEGYSYPKAMSLAFKQIGANSDMLDLTKPNNILGYQYVSGIKKHSLSILPFTIQRVLANYHDENLPPHSIASATSIRKAIFENNGNIESVNAQVPFSTKEELSHYFNEYKVFHNWELYWPLLKYRIISSSIIELNEIYEMEEGLEYRMKTYAIQAESFHEFMQKIKTKRYTWTRLQRACTQILMNFSKEKMQNENKTPSYLRLLGMTEKGRIYLNEQKKKIELPVISKTSAYQELLDTDIKASRIYSLVLSQTSGIELSKREFKPPIYIK